MGKIQKRLKRMKGRLKGGRIKYSYYTLGKERSDACLQRIRERIKDSDSERVVRVIVEHEVMLTCKDAPFTLNMLDAMFNSDEYEFGNGWVIDALEKRLDKVEMTSPTSLSEGINAILSSIKACIYGNVEGEMYREVNDVKRPLVF